MATREQQVRLDKGARPAAAAAALVRLDKAAHPSTTAGCTVVTEYLSACSAASSQVRASAAVLDLLYAVPGRSFLSASLHR